MDNVGCGCVRAAGTVRAGVTIGWCRNALLRKCAGSANSRGVRHPPPPTRWVVPGSLPSPPQTTGTPRGKNTATMCEDRAKHRGPRGPRCSAPSPSLQRRTQRALWAVAPKGLLSVGGVGVGRRGFWLPSPPLCDIPSGCCSFTGPWTVTRSSLRMLRRVATFCYFPPPRRARARARVLPHGRCRSRAVCGDARPDTVPAQRKRICAGLPARAGEGAAEQHHGDRGLLMHIAVVQEVRDLEGLVDRQVHPWAEGTGGGGALRDGGRRAGCAGGAGRPQGRVRRCMDDWEATTTAMRPLTIASGMGCIFWAGFIG